MAEQWDINWLSNSDEEWLESGTFVFISTRYIFYTKPKNYYFTSAENNYYFVSEDHPYYFVSEEN